VIKPMPIYEYRCQSCANELEVTQRIVDPPLVECPACHQPSLEKLISPTSFVLKGSGWYKDGYGGKKGAERTETERSDRLEKAISDDKKKTAEATSPASGESSTSSTTASSTTTSSTPTSSTSKKEAA